MPVDCKVDWAKSFYGTAREEREETRRSRSMLCQLCCRCLIDLPYIYGMVYVTDTGKDWEQRCLVDCVGDLPMAMPCFRCHYRTLPRRFYSAGGCFGATFALSRTERACEMHVVLIYLGVMQGT